MLCTTSRNTLLHLRLLLQLLILIQLLLQLLAALPVTYQLLHCCQHAFNRPMVCLTSGLCSWVLVFLPCAAAAATAYLLW
jgi:hypothetical protein